MRNNLGVVIFVTGASLQIGCGMYSTVTFRRKASNESYLVNAGIILSSTSLLFLMIIDSIDVYACLAIASPALRVSSSFIELFMGPLELHIVESYVTCVCCIIDCGAEMRYRQDSFHLLLQNLQWT